MDEIDESTDMRALGREAGLVSFDTALPQGWVDQQIALNDGKYPFGFVWSYDNSPFLGEPYPLTEYARNYAREAGILPR